MGPYDLINSINRYFADIQHPILREYPVVTFLSQLCLILIYLLSVKIIGPYLMKNRPAFTLRKTLIAYNFFQVIANFYLFIKFGKITYFGSYSIWCQPEEDFDSPLLIDYFKYGWMTLMDKWIDCLDTIFFVLRKKNNQISVLHLFHHGVVPTMTWVGLTFYLGGHCTFAFFMNFFVHVVMYSYYMLSAFGPNMQKILNPYKKYLTIMQIIQFVLAIVQVSAGLVNGCNLKTWGLILQLFYGIVFLVMFCNFYKEAYMKRKDTKLMQ